MVIFESKEANFAVADSPAQDAHYQKFVALLEEPPEWHDGVVIHANLDPNRFKTLLE